MLVRLLLQMLINLLRSATKLARARNVLSQPLQYISFGCLPRSGAKFSSALLAIVCSRDNGKEGIDVISVLLAANVNVEERNETMATLNNALFIASQTSYEGRPQNVSPHTHIRDRIYTQM
jgi:hypothetical protein